MMVDILDVRQWLLENDLAEYDTKYIKIELKKFDKDFKFDIMKMTDFIEKDDRVS